MRLTETTSILGGWNNSHRYCALDDPLWTWPSSGVDHNSAHGRTVEALRSSNDICQFYRPLDLDAVLLRYSSSTRFQSMEKGHSLVLHDKLCCLILRCHHSSVVLRVRSVGSSVEGSLRPRTLCQCIRFVCQHLWLDCRKFCSPSFPAM